MAIAPSGLCRSDRRSGHHDLLGQRSLHPYPFELDRTIKQGSRVPKSFTTNRTFDSAECAPRHPSMQTKLSDQSDANLFIGREESSRHPAYQHPPTNSDQPQLSNLVAACFSSLHIDFSYNMYFVATKKMASITFQ